MIGATLCKQLSYSLASLSRSFSMLSHLFAEVPGIEDQAIEQELGGNVTAALAAAIAADSQDQRAAA